MLALAEEVAGATQLQVLLRNFKAVIGAGHDLQSPPGLLTGMLRQQDAVALNLTTAHPATQLVQLGQAEALGVLHHHTGGVGDVHAHLHHGGGHQNIALPGGKGLHDLLLFLRLHLAVEHRYPQVREGLLL